MIKQNIDTTHYIFSFILMRSCVKYQLHKRSFFFSVKKRKKRNDEALSLKTSLRKPRPEVK